MNRDYIGGSFDEFLAEDGIFEECKDSAIKKVIAYQIANEMKERHITKTDMAQNLETSRAAIDRLLNPDNDSVTLHTLKKAAEFIGKQVNLELVDP